MDREVPVVLKLYELTLWTMNHTAQFPRHHRYSLGTRIEATLLDLLDLLIAARYRRDNLIYSGDSVEWRFLKPLKRTASSGR